MTQEEKRARRSVYNKKYREAHKDQLSAYNKKWHEENRERVRNQRKQYREENREVIVARKKAYYWANRDRILGKHKKERIEVAFEPINPSEVWRPVKGYEGLYEVSNFARVRSLDVEKEYINRWGGVSRRLFYGSILKQIVWTNGYIGVGLHDNGKIKSVSVHRLVAEAFIPNPDNLPEVNHKDEDKTNNLPDNLEWCNGSYNVNYGTCKERAAKKKRKAIEQLTLDGMFVKRYEGVTIAARQNGYNKSCLADVARGRWKSAYGYIWRYAN